VLLLIHKENNTKFSKCNISMRGCYIMLNLLSKSKLNENQVDELNNTFERLENCKVMIEFEFLNFNPTYGENNFYGCIDDDGIYIGDINYSPLIQWEYIRDVHVNKLDKYIEIVILLDNDFSVKLYN
jgi:hypothetical protein